MPDLFYAIDPGANGGIAWRRDDWPRNRVELEKLPAMEPDIVNLLRRIRDDNADCCMLGLIEDVGVHMKGNNAQSSATFAAHCGLLRGAAYALQISFSEPDATKWMEAFLGTMPKVARAGDEQRLFEASKMRKLTDAEVETLDKLRKKRAAHQKKLRKGEIKVKAQQLYPKLRVYDWNSDAIGMLHTGIYIPGFLPQRVRTGLVAAGVVTQAEAVPPPPIGVHKAPKRKKAGPTTRETPAPPPVPKMPTIGPCSADDFMTL